MISDSVIECFPDEVVTKVLENLDVNKLLALNQHGTNRMKKLVEDRRIWSKKGVKIITTKQFQQTFTNGSPARYSTILDLAGSGIGETTFVKLIGQMACIKSIILTGLSFDFNDDLAEILFRAHGKHLRKIVVDRSYQLTNQFIQFISEYCPNLRHLSLYGCMFSSAAVSILGESPTATKLRYLNLGRCHLMSFGKIRNDLIACKSLRFLSLANNDSVYFEGLHGLFKDLPHLSSLDIADCIEITKKDVRNLKASKPGLEVKHSSAVEDHSIESIRSFIQSIMSIPRM